MSIARTSWQLTASRICLQMNCRSSPQRRSVPRWRTELWRQILRQWWEDWFLSRPGPAISLTHIYIQESPVSESELANISGTKECTFVESEDRDMETNFEAAVRGLFHIVEDSCLLWRTSESRNRLKTPGRSFPQQHSISWPPGNRP